MRYVNDRLLCLENEKINMKTNTIKLTQISGYIVAWNGKQLQQCEFNPSSQQIPDLLLRHRKGDKKNDKWNSFE